MEKQPLFRGIAEPELSRLLRCLIKARKTYEKGAYIFRAGEACKLVGIVESGGVHVVQESFWGDRSILTHVGPGGVFGEAFPCAGIAVLPVSAVAAESCRVLLLDAEKLLAPCDPACSGHIQLMENLLSILARKNVMLTQKMTHITRRTTREKLLSYLSEQALRSGSAEFDIPFTRQELADYLAVDRSAMSGVLCGLRDEGILRFRKSHFCLIHPASD